MLLAVAGRDTSTAFISRLGSSYGAYRPFGTSLKFQEACGLKALSYRGEDPRKAYRASDSGAPRHHVSRLRWPMKRLAPYDRSRRPSSALDFQVVTCESGPGSLSALSLRARALHSAGATSSGKEAPQTSWRACATPDGSWLSVRLPSLSSESPISASRSAAFLFRLYTDQQPALGLGKEMGRATQAKHTAEDATSEGPRRNRERARARARARGGARKERSWIRISWRWRHSTVAARALDGGLQPVHEWGTRFSAPTRFWLGMLAFYYIKGA